MPHPQLQYAGACSVQGWRSAIHVWKPPMCAALVCRTARLGTWRGPLQGPAGEDASRCFDRAPTLPSLVGCAFACSSEKPPNHSVGGTSSRPAHCACGPRSCSAPAWPLARGAELAGSDAGACACSSGPSELPLRCVALKAPLTPAAPAGQLHPGRCTQSSVSPAGVAVGTKQEFWVTPGKSPEGRTSISEVVRWPGACGLAGARSSEGGVLRAPFSPPITLHHLCVPSELARKWPHQKLRSW